MGLETTPPIMSTLNPNASEFVPAARRVVAEEDSKVCVPVVPSAAVVHSAGEEYTPEWWSRLETDTAFREQCLSRLAFQSAEERNALFDDLDELADLDQFLGYQEELADMEEEQILARNLQDMDCFLDEDLSLTMANNFKEVNLPKEVLPRQQQLHPSAWSKNSFQYHNKTMPQKVGSYPNRWNTYRIHQPRSDM